MRRTIKQQQYNPHLKHTGLPETWEMVIHHSRNLGTFEHHTGLAVPESLRPNHLASIPWNYHCHVKLHLMLNETN